MSQVFVQRLEEDVKKIYHRFKYIKEMILHENDVKNYNKATHCHTRERELGEDRVRDHCHLTGKFRGAGHNGCSLKYKNPKFVPVIFHNLSGYDSHLFIKNLGVSEDNISCLPNN